MSLELNSCFLIDYRLWAAKSEGRHGSSSASSSASSIPLNLGVGCAPSCWPIFGFRTSWVVAGGSEGSFLCSLSSRFSGGGGGVGSPPRAWRRVGVPPAASVLKKICEIGVGFSFAALLVFRLRRAEAASALWIPHWHSEPCESQGTRAAKRYVNGNLVEREKGDEFGIKLLLPHRLSPVGSKK